MSADNQTDTGYLFDASYLIAFAMQDDLLHPDAVTLTRKILAEPAQGWYVLTASLIEVVDVVKMKYNFQAAQDVYEFYTDAAHGFTCLPDSNSREVFAHEVNKRFFAHNNLSYTDCLLLQIAQQQKYSLITFDKELKKAATKR